jgi:dolichol-phosphate mannosyltransferase
MNEKILIFTATFNEISNIKIYLKIIYKLKLNANILIVDDSSKDGTLNFLKIQSKINPKLKLIIRKKKLGLDSAHKIAFNYAKKNKYKYLITMDADLSHDPKEILTFLKLLKKKPFILGSRYINGGSCDYTGIRFLLSYFGNKFIKLFLKINVNEFTNSYRGFNLSMLKKLDLNIIKSKGYTFFMETIFLLNKLNIKIHQTPIQFRSRHGGYSKIPKIEILRTLLNILRLKFFRDF